MRATLVLAAGVAAAIGWWVLKFAAGPTASAAQWRWYVATPLAFLAVAAAVGLAAIFAERVGGSRSRFALQCLLIFILFADLSAFFWYAVTWSGAA